MRSPSAFEWSRPRAWTLGVILVAAVAAVPATVWADDKQECSAAYDQTQALRKTGKLSAARQQAVACMRDACAEFIRTDCVKWLGEIDASQPSVVFEVRDAAGGDTAAVRVSLDGKPWLQKIELRAVAIDPGEHTIRYEIDGAPAHEESVRIREGDKNRKLSFSFQASSAAPIDGAAPAAQPAPEEKRSVAPWVVGGVGVAGLIVGGVFGGLTLAAKSTVNGGCSSTTHTCSQDAHDAAGRGQTFGPVSTVGLVIGGAGVVTSIVLFATRKSASTATSPSVGVNPVVTPSGARLRIEGSF
jgi:hypothetical protein